MTPQLQGALVLQRLCALRLVTELHRRYNFSLTPPSTRRCQARRATARAEGCGLQNVTFILGEMKEEEKEEDGEGEAGAAEDG